MASGYTFTQHKYRTPSFAESSIGQYCSEDLDIIEKPAGNVYWEVVG